MVGSDCCEDRNHCQLNVSAGKSLRGLLQALWYQPICHLINTHKTKTGVSGTPAIKRLDVLTVLLTLPCSRVWSKDGPSYKVKSVTALYTGASRAACQEPVSALSNLFPIWEEHTFNIPDAFYTQEKTHNSHANLEPCCIPFSGTAVGHWRQARRAERLNGLCPMKREQVGEQGCQQGEMLTLLVSFHSLASLAPWKKQM